jgi:HD-GYP domain-containing protein (c-di-GMP phosphodiesterase class II)
MLANDIAIWIGCSSEQVGEIQAAAILHDIGKITVPDYILFKPGQLTLDEYNEVKRHQGATVEIIRNLNWFTNLLPIIEEHHERYNSAGYPNRLKADEIELGSRIISVADAYDAMTSPRPYRSRLSNEDAIRIIKEGSGTQWDPMIVYAFIEMIGPSAKVFDLRPAQNLELEEEDNVKLSVRQESRINESAPLEENSVQANKESRSRAQEALERAKHWAHWMETMENVDKEE